MNAAARPLDDVLVVIPCLDEERHLPTLLDALVAEAPEATVAIADGGSSDRSPEIVARFADSHPNVVFVHNSKRIQSAGVNTAVERLGRDRKWLVRIDAHCRYPAGYISGLVRTAERHGAGSVVVPMRTVGTTPFQSAVAAAQNSRLGTGGAAHRVGVRAGLVDHGHHALMSLAAFRQSGGYCELLSHNEDAELDLRLARQGTRIWLEPSLAIEYLPRASPLSLFRQYLGYGRGRAQTLLRHRVRPRLRQVLPLAVAPAVAAAPAGAIEWWLAAPAGGWATLCLGWGIVLAARMRNAAVLFSGPAAMLMHLGWSIGFWRQLPREWRQGRTRDWRGSLRFARR